MGILDLPGPEFLVLFLSVCGAASLGAFALRAFVRPPDGNVGSRTLDLDPFECAYLAGGEKQAVDAVFSALVQRDLVTVNTESQIVSAKGTLPAELDPHERRLHEMLLLRSLSVEDMRERMGAHFGAARGRLQQMGLLIEPDRLWLSRTLPIMLLVAAFALGAAKLMVGLSRERPITFLVLILVLLTLEIAVFMSKPPHRSRLGDRALAALRSRNAALQATAASRPTGVAPNDMALAIGLFGPALVTYGAIGALTGPRDAAGRKKDAGSSSCGSSCSTGGGGCGGGCGGCGGCGG